MRVFVTGACGYKGSVLVPKLLRQGHEVVAFDIMWFGNYLQPHPQLQIVRGDVRDIDAINLDGVNAIVHLSSVANDPCGDLDPKLTWEISCLATMQLANKAVAKGVKQLNKFIGVAVNVANQVEHGLLSTPITGTRPLRCRCRPTPPPACRP